MARERSPASRDRLLSCVTEYDLAYNWSFYNLKFPLSIVNSSDEKKELRESPRMRQMEMKKSLRPRESRRLSMVGFQWLINSLN